MAIAKDKFWMFGVRAHEDDKWLLPAIQGTPTQHFYDSRITAGEGAFMLDIPNMLMVVVDSDPAPYSKNAIGYMESFCRMKNVMWGACRGGEINEYELGFILQLAQEYPNLTGVFMDDVSEILKSTQYTVEEKQTIFLDMLKRSRDVLNQADRKLDTYITWYWHDDPVPGMLDYVDGLSLWTWDSRELPLLKERFEALEKKCQGLKLMLGIYMYDFKNRKPISDDMMEMQCNYALELLKEKRIEGVIFHANTVMGVNMTSEHWLRRWITENKNTAIPD